MSVKENFEYVKAEIAKAAEKSGRNADDVLLLAVTKLHSPEEMNELVVAEYYPGVMSRVYLKGLSNETMQSVVDEYVHRLCRRRRIRGLLGCAE